MEKHIYKTSSGTLHLRNVAFARATIRISEGNIQVDGPVQVFSRCGLPMEPGPYWNGLMSLDHLLHLRRRHNYEDKSAKKQAFEVQFFDPREISGSDTLPDGIRHLSTRIPIHTSSPMISYIDIREGDQLYWKSEPFSPDLTGLPDFVQKFSLSDLNYGGLSDPVEFATAIEHYTDSVGETCDIYLLNGSSKFFRDLLPDVQYLYRKHPETYHCVGEPHDACTGIYLINIPAIALAYSYNHGPAGSGIIFNNGLKATLAYYASVTTLMEEQKLKPFLRADRADYSIWIDLKEIAYFRVLPNQHALLVFRGGMEFYLDEGFQVAEGGKLIDYLPVNLPLSRFTHEKESLYLDLNEIGTVNLGPWKGPIAYLRLMLASGHLLEIAGDSPIAKQMQEQVLG